MNQRPPERLAIAIAQLNPIVGDVAGNAERVRRARAAAAGEGADLVVNLAAGLDTRPYRMDLPSSLLWVEVDLPDLLDYKDEVLKSESPRCRLERVRLDLSNRDARRALFGELGARAKKALIVTEGLIIYLTAEQVGELARDLAGPSSFERWALDLVSPGLLRLLQRELQPRLIEGGAKMQFGPKEGPLFFLPYGWKPLEVHAALRQHQG